MTEDTKRCSVCGYMKDLTEFGKLKKGKSGINYECRACNNARGKAWWVNNPERVKAYQSGGHIMLRKARGRAKNKGIPFDITIEDIVIPELCPYLGIKLQWGDVICHDASPSLDRIIPKLGYIKGNIEVISLRANKMKNCGTPDEIMRIGIRMYRQLMGDKYFEETKDNAGSEGLPEQHVHQGQGRLCENLQQALN